MRLDERWYTEFNSGLFLVNDTKKKVTEKEQAVAMTLRQSTCFEFVKTMF